MVKIDVQSLDWVQIQGEMNVDICNISNATPYFFNIFAAFLTARMHPYFQLLERWTGNKVYLKSYEGRQELSLDFLLQFTTVSYR